MCEITYKANTKIIKKRISDKYGSIPKFVPHTVYSQKTIYSWLRTGEVDLKALGLFKDLLGFDSFDEIIKREGIITYE